MTAHERRSDSSGPARLGRRPVATVRSSKGRERPWRKWARRIVVTLVTLLVVGFGGIAGLFWYYGRDLPAVATLREYHPPQVTRVVDRHGEVLDEIFTERRTVIPMDKIPRVFVLCVLAAEDADFYRHEGLDYPGILRALVRGAMHGGRVQGTSTITQQIVKNMLLTSERSLDRKIKELILARRLEQELTKDEILHLYLNQINFGHGRYGVEEASQYYFGHPAESLTLAEASLIAGIPQSPSHLSPRVHPEAARRRQRFILDQLEQKRAEYWPDLTLEQIQEAREAEPRIVPLATENETAPEVVRMARELLRERVGAEAMARGGYVVHTTIDLALQRQARASLRQGLMEYDERHAARVPLKAPTARGRRVGAMPRVDALHVGRTYDAAVTGTSDEAGTITLDVGGHRAVARIADLARFNPRNLPPSEAFERGARVHASVQRLADRGEENAAADVRLELGPEGCVVMIDPRTRGVVALVGGYATEEGFDRARQALRQPGSTFKPIVYAMGIQQRRYTPATLVLDAPAVYDQWAPQNYETFHYQGAIRLREAIAQSVNLVAVRVMEDLGPQNVLPFAEKLGITSRLEPSLALVLGASEVRPVELVNAYATFAAAGRWEPLRYITRIEGPDGDVPLPEVPEGRDVLTPSEAYVVTSLLMSVVQTGTATAARRLGRTAAGKTGTSNEARDAWFVGYTTDYVAGVWIGYDEAHRSLGRRESGARTALPVWISLMTAAEHGRPVVDFPQPSGIVTAPIDPVTGRLAYDGMPGAIDEIFLDGTVPRDASLPPDVADPNAFLMEQIGGAP